MLKVLPIICYRVKDNVVNCGHRAIIGMWEAVRFIFAH